MTKKEYLDDIVVIRLILIVLLIVYHTFAPYSTWSPISDEKNLFYEFICQVSYSFMLPSFVFISGLIAGYQIHLKGKPTKRWLLKKFKRLIIPSIFFSLIYFIIFENSSGPSNLKDAYEILNGVGHMWFLPMLFWCFVMLFAIVTIINNDRYIKLIVALSMIGSVCAFVPLPLRMINAVYYFNFFYIGFLFGCKKVNKLKYVNGGGYFLGYVFLFGIYWSLRGVLEVKLEQYDTNLLIKSCWLMIGNMIQLSYKWFGTLAIYSVVNFLINRRYIHLSSTMRTIGSYCFGVYIFQQFILVILYYRSDFIFAFPINAVPWIAFTITLILSLVLTYLSLKTRIGRLLIG